MYDKHQMNARRIGHDEHYQPLNPLLKEAGHIEIYASFKSFKKKGVKKESQSVSMGIVENWKVTFKLLWLKTRAHNTPCIAMVTKTSLAGQFHLKTDTLRRKESSGPPVEGGGRWAYSLSLRPLTFSFWKCFWKRIPFIYLYHFIMSMVLLCWTQILNH